MINKELYRSILYMPGSNDRALEKTKDLACDGFIFDLEDAVSPSKKKEARELVRNFVTTNRASFDEKKIIVRVNSWDTIWGSDDFHCAAEIKPDAILLPKISCVDDFEKYFQMVKEPLDPKIKIWAMIETASAILNIKEISLATKRLEAFVLGTNDLAKELNINMDTSRQALITAISMVNMASKAYSLFCLDGVYNSYKDLDGLRLECEQGKNFGLDGKTLIHPCQIEISNAVFSPTDKEVELAKAYMEAFLEAKQSGLGVAVVNGKIVENLHIEMAKGILAKVELIEKKTQKKT